MRAHRGQVALYLVAVLVAICVLAVMNVGIYLSVSAKNKAMNAGDAAALAVANYQGELLNRIGQLNVDHLKAAIEDDDAQCQQIMAMQLRCCFLGPISGADGCGSGGPYGGISAGNKYAKENGAERQKELEDLLRAHAQDVRNLYASHPDSYPPPWEGAWEEYARALELAVSAGIWAGPDNINFIDTKGGHILLNRQFYNAIAGRSWCWFKFHASGLLDSYANFHSWGPLPIADDVTRKRRCDNCEVYSLNLHRYTGSAVDLFGTNLICRLTGATMEELENSSLIHDRTHSWMLYDDSVWRKWTEIDPTGKNPFPVVGKVKPQYDVLGCAALCRVVATGANLLGDGDENEFAWTAGAKPFGTVVNEDGETDVVTADNFLVTPAFECSRLVPIDTVGGKDLSTADPEWLKHIHYHLPVYLERGPMAVGAKCQYCRQLRVWERPTFRRRGVIWLKYHSDECERYYHEGSEGTGEVVHGH